MTYGKKLLIAFDQLANAFLGGWPDETLSSRAWRWDLEDDVSWPRKLIDALFFWEKDHCRDAYYSEVERRQCPPELRTDC